jgi:hypothetical protein
MAEALKTFREGEDILASETNENNQFLLSKLSDNAAQVQNYVEGEVASIKSNVASVQATLQNNIDGVSTLLNDVASNIYHYMSPDHSKRAPRSRDTLYTAEEAGWVFFYGVSGNANQVTYTINGQNYYLCSNLNRDTDTAGAGVWFMVGKGDTYRFNSAGTSSVWQAFYFPCKGMTKEAE